MNTAAGRKDPKAVNQLISMLESGMSPAEAAKRMEEEAERAALQEVEGPDEEEEFPDEIKIISQALAFRKAEPEDLMSIMKLLNAAYGVEVGQGEESFRSGDPVSVEVVIRLFDDSSYEWLVTEAPNGQEVLQDGAILGVCVYSTDGASRRNGQVEGKLGSVRLLAVLPRLHGLCIGLRLLKKAEALMYKTGCVRCLVCIPSVRKSLSEWLQHRGYQMAGLTAYPASATEQTVRPEFDLDDGEEGKRGRLRSLRLMHYMKKLEDVAPTAEADSKGRRKASSKTSTEGAGVEEGETVFDSVVQLTGDLRIAKTPEVSAATAVMEGEGSVQKPPEVVPGKMHLPPHWRHAGPSAEQQAILDAATAEAVRSIQGDIVNAARGEDTPPID
jgi:GNAT superfamily N-acetyltransferase